MVSERDLDRCVQLLFASEKVDVLLAIIKILVPRTAKQPSTEDLVITVFNEALNR